MNNELFDITPKYILRDYQQAASDAAVEFFNDNKAKFNAILVEPTGAGKALIIADIARRIEGNLLVFQPSKEILEQNYEKLRSFGVECSIWSASMNKKERSRITYATIGSVRNCHEEFKDYRNIIIDEVHLVSSLSGSYKDFIMAEERKVIGLTGTPYRLNSVMGSAMLKFITRTRPRIFSKVLHVTQTSMLVERGYLAKLQYFDMMAIDASKVRRNTTGMDYDDASLRQAYYEQHLDTKLFNIVVRLLHPKSGVPRKGILVFTRYVDESAILVENLRNNGINAEYVSADTPKRERERIIRDLKEGKISVVSNASVLAVGFDYPALDTVVLARPTMSLALYTQMIGRAIRKYDGKDGWIVDLCGNYAKFGRTDELWIGYDPNANGYAVTGIVKNEDGIRERKILTGVRL